MKMFKIIKAMAILVTMFKDKDKLQEMINLYEHDTGKEITLEELIYKTEEEIRANPRTNDFTDWATEQILKKL